VESDIRQRATGRMDVTATVFGRRMRRDASAGVLVAKKSIYQVKRVLRIINAVPGRTSVCRICSMQRLSFGQVREVTSNRNTFPPQVKML
jgi:hypothetical protein